MVFTKNTCTNVCPSTPPMKPSRLFPSLAISYHSAHLRHKKHSFLLKLFYVPGFPISRDSQIIFVSSNLHLFCICSRIKLFYCERTSLFSIYSLNFLNSPPLPPNGFFSSLPPHSFLLLPTELWAFPSLRPTPLPLVHLSLNLAPPLTAFPPSIFQIILRTIVLPFAFVCSSFSSSSTITPAVFPFLHFIFPPFSCTCLHSIFTFPVSIVPPTFSYPTYISFRFQLLPYHINPNVSPAA